MDTSYKINTRRIGTAHERQAETFLKAKGYRILARNYRCRSGEIDLIATDTPVRYDVVAVLGGELVHLENAFPYLGASAY